MILLSYQTLFDEFKRVLKTVDFPTDRLDLCAKIYADNTLDGVNSHGINRFPIFIRTIKEKRVNLHGQPVLKNKIGQVEHWDGQEGPGMLNAWDSMNRAIALAQENGIGLVTLSNNNHWMRGGTYGWQAADAGCVGICFTNAIASMPPYGGKESRLGNNPIVIAVPRKEGNIVLDMAISQFSYGKMYSYELDGKQLPIPGGYDDEGHLTTDPHVIRKTMRALPIGLWKGSGLALLLDIVLTALSGGKSTADVTPVHTDTGVSQAFIAIHQDDLHDDLVKRILDYTKTAGATEKDGQIYYPGERTLMTRKKNLEKGIPVNEHVWEKVKAL